MKVGRFEGLSSCVCPHPSHQVIIGRAEASTKGKLKVSDQRRSRATVLWWRQDGRDGILGEIKGKGKWSCEA